MHPNVLFIVFDTARADAFGTYGAGPDATPVADDLARRGTSMPQAVATSSWTMPSHVSMFTGLHPREFGLRRGAWTPEKHRQSLNALFERATDRTLAEVLRRAGYETRAVSTNSWVGAMNGFGTGFDRFESIRGRRNRDPRSLKVKMEWWRRRVDDGAAAAEAILRSWVAEPGDGRPFFWFVNLMECHAPYSPPKPYNDLGPVARWRAIEDFSKYQSWLARLRVAVHDIDVPDEAVERMRHLYGRAIRLMDDLVGRLLESLDAAKRLDDTLVILTADHGENLGEGHLMGHVLSLDHRLVRVPFFAAGPVRIEPKPLWTLASVPAAIAGAIDLPNHPWGEDRAAGLAYSSYEGLIQTPAPETLENARKFGFPEEAIRRIDVPLASVTDGRFKLVRTGAVEDGTTDVLHDLESDPLELMDVAKDHPDRTQALRAALEQEDARWAAAAGAPLEAGGAIHETTAQEQAEIEEHLKALGYL